MKRINRNLLEAILNPVMALIFLFGFYYLFTSESLSTGLYGLSEGQIMNDIRFQFAMVGIFCSGVGLLLLNTK